MFDEQPKPQGAQPVVDMFDGSNSGAPRPQAPRPPASSSATPSPLLQAPPAQHASPAVYEAPHGSSFGIVKIFLLFMLVVVLVAGAGYAAWRIMAQEPASDGPVKSVDDGSIVGNDDETDEQDEEDEEKTPDENAPAEDDDQERRRPVLGMDSDGDGLTNADELEAGTLSNDPDTDDDGLGDREEVKVYDTDPRDEDTDGDTFLDGQEVASGYNPNGDGKLFDVPTE